MLGLSAMAGVLAGREPVGRPEPPAVAKDLVLPAQRRGRERRGRCVRSGAWIVREVEVVRRLAGFGLVEVGGAGDRDESSFVSFDEPPFGVHLGG